MSPMVAVSGTGSIGMRHLTLLQQLEGVRPIAVPKRKERLAVLQSQGFVVASSLKEAADQGAKLAVIASNTGEHVHDSLSAIECEMDLLVEKPLSVDAVQSWEIYQAAQKKQRKLFVGCPLRFSESLNIFREWLPKIGRVYAVRIECQSFLPDWRPRPYQESYSAKAVEGGVLRDLIHEIDYAIWLFGRAKNVRANLQNTGRLRIEAEEFAELWWQTDSGASVSLCLDYLSRIPRRQMRAFGEKGNLEWDGIAQKVSLQQPKHSEEFLSRQSRDEMYLAQLKTFLKACSTSKSDSFLASGLEGFEALRVCDTARSSKP